MLGDPLVHLIKRYHDTGNITSISDAVPTFLNAAKNGSGDKIAMSSSDIRGIA